MVRLFCIFCPLRQAGWVKARALLDWIRSPVVEVKRRSSAEAKAPWWRREGRLREWLQLLGAQKSNLDSWIQLLPSRIPFVLSVTRLRDRGLIRHCVPTGRPRWLQGNGFENYEKVVSVKRCQPMRHPDHRMRPWATDKLGRLGVGDGERPGWTCPPSVSHTHRMGPTLNEHVSRLSIGDGTCHVAVEHDVPPPIAV